MTRFSFDFSLSRVLATFFGALIGTGDEGPGVDPNG